ncbi:hypothetical protein [Halorubrum sp. BV1]|uniref:hypothetical protein n=1 Tax=Halorubrum sp. BV1 TaxID=1498500 RepID=UPI000A497E1A|nr:hypothetical protein [Halorubrum sp. BV1]
MSDEPRGLAVSDRFAEYLERFRERHPLDADLAEKYGLPTGNGHFRRLMAQTQTSDGYGGTA